jgi:hypothetical protein
LNGEQLPGTTLQRTGFHIDAFNETLVARYD